MKKEKLLFASIISFALALAAFSSCNNNAGEKKTTATDSTINDTKQVDSLTAGKKTAIEFKFATVEANFPSPFEIVNDLHTYQAPFNGSLLNPSANADKYISTFKKEVNLGVYGIDMAYINFYGKNQDMVNYFSTIMKMAKDLNMEKTFDEYAERFKANSGNHDSVISIVDKVFDQGDKYLKKNERFVSASHILAGALIELNYLSLNLIKDIKRTPENGAFFDKVYNENVYFYHLIKLYEEYTDKDSKALLADLKTYSAAYNGMIKSSADLTEPNISKAITLVDDIRNKLVK
jgi:hypothetical protein